MNKIHLSVIGMVLTLITASFTQAQQPSESKPNSFQPQNGAVGAQHPHGPPPEAYQACESKAVGSQSSFTSPRGDVVKGYCENDGNGKIVLRPERGKQADSTDEHCGPPPEAYAACENKTSGSQSQFVNPRGDTVIGICEKEGDKLVLRPDRPAKPDVRGKANVKRSGS